LNGNHRRWHDSEETDGVLSTKTVLQKTYGNPGTHRQSAASYGRFLINSETCPA